MALQPASGVRDLNPQQVQRNQELRETLAGVFRLWGFEEVTPPRIERMDTLKAGGAIDSRDIVRLVSDEPLGLRPELTASIARAACTRLQQRQRPLRLWSCGTVFESRVADEGGQCIEEILHCGVELFGGFGVEAELELFSLLMASMRALQLQPRHQPKLLIGHTDLLNLLLKPFDGSLRDRIRGCLSQYDRLGLRDLVTDTEELNALCSWLDRRGTAQDILAKLQRDYPDQAVLNRLQRLIDHLIPLANASGVQIQLDPTFQPLYELYD
ncbi:MAG: ATP phosphoribosyltransferase regulatory subunit, partial [Cyanobacteriota bacterium]|nr:ATP phosphoribosyltransferase regulatory subunit [Cyanobacteriota bacterium]